MTSEGCRPRRLREVQREHNREHMLRVAATLIAEKGFTETTIDDLVGHAGTSRATIYTYFGGKDAILAAIRTRMFDSAEEMYRAFGELAEWSPLSVRRWLRDVVARWDDEMVYMRAHASGVSNYDDIYLDYHRRFVAGLTANSALWSRFDPEDADRRALFLINGLELFLSTWLIRGWPGAVDETLETLTDIWCRVLEVPAAPTRGADR